MVDLNWMSKMVPSEMTSKSPRLSNKLQISIPASRPQVSELSASSDGDCAAYEQYLRLVELKKLWNLNEYPDWKSESMFRPAFTGLEITFRLISTVLTDSRPYANRREWRRRLEALASSEIEIISLLCEEEEEDEETKGMIPLASSDGESEVWKASNEETVVCRVSESSLLPRLAIWHKSEDVARKIQFLIECQMQSCPFTLGLGEPNLGGKRCLDYDNICKPAHLKKSPAVEIQNSENHTLYSTHQILESWIRVAKHLLEQIYRNISSNRFERASSDCWILEKVWIILIQVEDLHLLVDPDDFLSLKNHLSIKGSLSGSDLFCFRSRELVAITKNSKELKHRVPSILDVEVDPTGGPGIQDAAMELYRKREEPAKIHLLQAMQAVEAAVKRFYFCYKQLLTVVMGSLEAKGSVESGDLLSQIFLEPTYFPSLDAAKTFLGERRSHERPRRRVAGN